MTEKHNRRRFLQTSLATGTVLAVGGANALQGDNRLADPPGWDANPPARSARALA